MTKIISPYTPEPKRIKGIMNYQITIKDGNVDLDIQDSNEVRLISMDLTRKVLTEIANNLRKKDFHGEELKNVNISVRVLDEYISAIGQHILEKYKDAVPEEKKVKILKFNPAIDKLPKLKL